MGCASSPGNLVSVRHNAVRDVLYRFCTDNAIAVSRERILEEEKRIDLCMFLGSSCIFVDTTVVSSDAKSYKKVSEATITKIKEAIKSRVYGPVTPKNVTFVTFLVDAHGGLSMEAWKLVRRLARAAGDPTAAGSLVALIVATVQRFSAEMVGALRLRLSPSSRSEPMLYTGDGASADCAGG